MILFLNKTERVELLRLVRRELDNTPPRVHRGTLDRISFLYKLKGKLS